jgi:vacuolar-type H+-ATPase subunit F/Vma7
MSGKLVAQTGKLMGARKIENPRPRDLIDDPNNHKDKQEKVIRRKVAGLIVMLNEVLEPVAQRTEMISGARR